MIDTCLGNYDTYKGSTLYQKKILRKYWNGNYDTYKGSTLDQQDAMCHHRFVRGNYDTYKGSTLLLLAIRLTHESKEL